MFLQSLSPELLPKCSSDIKYSPCPSATGEAVYPALFFTNLECEEGLSGNRRWKKKMRPKKETRTDKVWKRRRMVEEIWNGRKHCQIYLDGAKVYSSVKMHMAFMGGNESLWTISFQKKEIS